MTKTELVQLLCCPETHQAVAWAAPAEVERLNQAIAAGQVRNRAGQLVQEKLDGGLVRADGKYLYPVRREIPVMLVDESLPLAPG